MSINLIEQNYDIVVVGGGLSGMCAAIAAARHGAKTAIINNRSVYGGNASSEIRMHIVGASSHAAKSDLAETGILMEMLLENKRRNPYACFPVFDSILWETVHFQENLTSYLNTNMDDVLMEDGRIRTIICHQNTTETELRLSARIFVDATGHGTLGVMAGCGSRLGTEASSEFNEPDAPDMANTDTMGNTLMFSAVDRGKRLSLKSPNGPTPSRKSSSNTGNTPIPSAPTPTAARWWNLRRAPDACPTSPTWITATGGLRWAVTGTISSAKVRIFVTSW